MMEGRQKGGGYRIMEEKRDRAQGPSEEPASAYSDAYYREAPETRRSCYGYNPAQCYARATEGPAPAAEKRHTAAILLALGLVLALAVLVLGLLGSTGIFLSSRASAAETMPSRELYEDFSSAIQPEDDGLGLDLGEDSGEPAELSPEEIYELACRSTMGVNIPGYAYNIFGQKSASTVTGSGIVLTEDGYILTNFHVIQAAYNGGAPIMVIDFDGNEYPAQVIGVETDSDLAVLKIDAEGLTPAQLGDSDDIRVGQPIYAVGNPLGELTYTMTSGIVSALNRRITTDENITVNMFQIDAAVNNGNSGGPVYNTRGQVIGVVTAKFTLDGMEGLGFAIPINDTCQVVSDLVEKGYVSGKAYLGLTLAGVSPSVARYYDMVQGVFVCSVAPDSCAEKAGLTAGDVITAIDGVTVTSAKEFAQRVKSYRAGDSAELTVYRDSGYITVTVVFDEELPAERMSDAEAAYRASGDIVVRRG